AGNGNTLTFRCRMLDEASKDSAIQTTCSGLTMERRRSGLQLLRQVTFLAKPPLARSRKPQKRALNSSVGSHEFLRYETMRLRTLSHSFAVIPSWRSAGTKMLFRRM